MAGELRHLVQRGDAFWARKVVPKDLQPIIGRTELRTPLGSNRRIAERDLHAAIAAFNQTLADARAKLERSAVVPLRVRVPLRKRPLTTAQAAHTHYAEELALDDAGRNHPNVMAGQFFEWARAGFGDALRRVASGQAADEEIAAVMGWALDKFRDRGSISVQSGTSPWRAMARTLAQVQLEAIEAAIERDAGREPGSPKLPILAEAPAASILPFARKRDGASVSILGLLESYLRELQASGKGAEAERRWTHGFKALVRFLGHDDARHFTKADAVAWKDHLLGEVGLSPKTVRDTNLASLRAVFRWAADNGHIEGSPVADVRVKVGQKVRHREKGFTDMEAVAILRAALAYQSPPARSASTRESSHVAASKRWMPWLCALTGARVAEMAQLRGEDVQVRDGITYLRITPAAGSVKTGQFRDVPLHPQLVDLGFIDFVRAVGAGPLFYLQARGGLRHPAKVIAAKVGVWVRGLGLSAPNVDPNHGWRHRFKTVGREAGVDSRVLDAIQGHAPRTAGEDYGDVTLKARDAAIRKFPSYSLVESVP